MHLSAHSYFSLRYGTLSPEQLVQAAAAKGLRVLTLTDINNTSAALPFVRACERQGIKPILGVDFRSATGKRLYVGLARNAEGWAELCGLLTECSLSGKPLPEVAPAFEHCYVIYTEFTKPFQLFRDNEFVGIRPGQVHGLFSSSLRQHPHKLLVFSPVTCLDADGYRLHKLLRAIHLNTLATKLTPADLAAPDELLQTEQEVLTHYDLYPAIIANTRRVINNCSIAFETGLQRNRHTFTGHQAGDLALLYKLAESGCHRRYGEEHRLARERLQKELTLIEQLDFTTYFLITWDIVRYAQSVGYYHVGRGSGANSIVAYCLYITDVEPLELDLYFERFINPHRISPPDFDIDFSWDERDDVTDYIFKRYGRDYTALLATYTTFQPDSVVRELGKAFGLPKADLDYIVANLPALHQESQQTPPGGPLTEKAHVWTKHLLHFGFQLIDFPNYLSIHAGGIIISEAPLRQAAALQLMPKGFPIIQLDMYAAEDWGYHKFDVLSQRGLGHIKEAVEIIYRNQGAMVNIHDIDRIKQDAKVKMQLRSGRCIGCFYIESPAMRGLLQKLRCDNYLHLVAASSIIRPGVAQSGMMREYIHRFHSPYGFDYLHPVFEKHLAETFGVMVYQEDVMKIVHHFAGLDLDESDILRRMMTGKKRSSEAFQRLRDKYFANCAARGYPPQLTETVWRQIESFGGYSFCKAHSASFAVESFQSLWLKAYYPLEFMVAVINNFGGFYRPEFYVHELRQAGATVHAPCINHSEFLTAIQGRDVYLGFVQLRSLEQKLARQIVRQRREHGPFQGLEDFLRRVDIQVAQLTLLIRIGALRFTGQSKCTLLWEKNRILGQGRHQGQADIRLETPENQGRLPDLDESPFDQAFDELELLGFPLCSPFDLLANPPTADGLVASQLAKFVHYPVEILGYLVCTKETRTKKGESMSFGTWLDRDGHFFDTVHFPDNLRLSPFKGRGLYRIHGLVTTEFGFLSIQVNHLSRLPYRSDHRFVDL
ncbi:MAG: DNA polymerase III subunit alpha [Saprospiraceae bacterium]